MSLLARRVLVSDVPGDGGGAAWGHPLSSPLLRAPLPLSGQMGPHPLLPKDTESLCLRSQRLGGRHCRLLPLGRGAGGVGSSGPGICPLGSSSRNLLQIPHVCACSIAQTAPPDLTRWGILTWGWGWGSQWGGGGVLPHPRNGRGPPLPVAVPCLGWGHAP